MDEFVKYLVRNLVEDPTKVDVRVFEKEEGQVMIEVRVAQGDIGKVIGAKGRTIDALRTISMLVATRLGKRMQLQLIEEG